MESGCQLILECREEIIRSVIQRSGPCWWKWPFDWFDVCPMNDAATILGIPWDQRNAAYDLLQHYHCCGYWKIPPRIRESIPSLIREALSGKSMVAEKHNTPHVVGGSERKTAMALWKKYDD
jgi:hypothetical protein